MASEGPEWLLGTSDQQAACLELSIFRSEALRKIMGGTAVSPASFLASASLGGWAPFPVLTHHLEQGKQGYPGKHGEGRKRGHCLLQISLGSFLFQKPGAPTGELGGSRAAPVRLGESALKRPVSGDCVLSRSQQACISQFGEGGRYGMIFLLFNIHQAPPKGSIGLGLE